ncbi:MAG: phage tail sheath family protein [Chloroflexota bacterium]
MPTYLSPGVYVEEVDKGTKPIEAVGTAVAAFIGFTEIAADVRNGETKSLVGKPTLVTNWSQYVQKFGGIVPGIYTPDAVYGYFANGGGICYIVSLKTVGEAPAENESSASTAPKVNILAGDDKKTKLLEFSKKSSASDTRIDVTPGDKEGQTFNLTIVSGTVEEKYEGLTMGKGEKNAVTVLAQSQLISAKAVSKSELAPAAASYTLANSEKASKAVTLADYRGSVAERRGLGGLEPLEDVTMICVPDLMSSFVAGEIDLKGVQAVQQAVIDYCENVRYCFAILDTPPNLMPQEVKDWRFEVNYDTSRAALYYPWIEIADLTGRNGRTRMVPPSGHVAGIYARTDETRGVHKAPANEIVRNSLGLEVRVTKGEQDLLNPIGVNCIRSFPGRGIRVWGARTLSSDPSWRYINVRRLFNMIEESIERGTQWVVFEPNDEMLWARVRRDIGSFLKLVWRSGALFGLTPQQAFYVKCDEELNPLEVRDVGQLIVEVGISPVKPAEFVIFRISQWSGIEG